WCAMLRRVPLTSRRSRMAPHLARVAALIVLVMSAAVPVLAEAPPSAVPPAPSALYLEWLSGWSPQETGRDYLRIALDPETGTWGPAPVDQALQTSGITPPPL